MRYHLIVGRIGIHQRNRVILLGVWEASDGFHLGQNTLSRRFLSTG